MNFLEIIRLWDTKAYYWFNSFARMNEAASAIIIFRAEYAQYVVGLVLILMYAVTFLSKFRSYREKNFEMVVFSFVSAIVARWGIGELIYFLYDRARPFETLPFALNLIDRAPGHSFPSGHTLFFFALATGVSFYYPKTSILFFLGTISIALGRISAGVHWPSDVLAGAVLGVATAYLCRFIFLRVKK